MCLDLRALVLTLFLSFICIPNNVDAVNRYDKIVVDDLMSNIEVRANRLEYNEQYIPEEPTMEEIVREQYSEDEINLLALVTMAEAEGECEEGKRLVIDTVLNRVDCDEFDNSICDVVYAKHQFTSMWNGRINRVSITDEVINLVIEELYCRTNYDVIYFTAGHYGKYGTKLFAIGNHYFSSK